MQIKKEGFMSLFGKKKTELPALISDAELAAMDEQAVNYNTVVEWLVGLGDEDLAKVNKVVEINRKAYADTCGVLGLDVTPSSFINPPQPEPVAPAGNFLDDDDETPFLMDDIAPNTKAKKGRKVPVKNAKN